MARVQMTQAVAADYADAMLVARKAKNVLFFCLTFVLLIQLAVFFVVRYVPGMGLRREAPPSRSVTETQARTAATVPESVPTTSISTAQLPASASSTDQPAAPRAMLPWPLAYVIAATGFLGVILPIVLSIVLLLIIQIALIGKPKNLTGITHVTGAFVWSIFLIVLLFPWQSLSNGHENSAAMTSQPASAGPHSDVPDMKIPGVLYTWPELVRDYDFPTAPLHYAILKWSRFVAFPVLSLMILLMVQVRSSQGWRTAVGDAEVIVDRP